MEKHGAAPGRRQRALEGALLWVRSQSGTTPPTHGFGYAQQRVHVALLLFCLKPLSGGGCEKLRWRTQIDEVAKENITPQQM